MKTCDRCGVALTPGLGGKPMRIMVVFDNGSTSSVVLCGEHFKEVTHLTLVALLGEEATAGANRA